MALARRHAVFLAASLAALRSPVKADGAHAAFTIIEHNPRTQMLEVIHRIVALDLEIALTARLGKAIRLENDPDVESAFSSYLDDYFHISADGDQRLPLQWVGHEVFAPTVFAYQEAPWPKEATHLSIFNHVLTDAHPTQINTVNVTVGNRTQTRMFSEADGIQSVSLE